MLILKRRKQQNGKASSNEGLKTNYVYIRVQTQRGLRNRYDQLRSIEQEGIYTSFFVYSDIYP